MAKTAAAIIEDRKWEEERYARQLAEADAIRKDPKKMKMASRGAARLAKNQRDEANAMEKIAKSKRKKS